MKKWITPQIDKSEHYSEIKEMNYDQINSELGLATLVNGWVSHKFFKIVLTGPEPSQAVPANPCCIPTKSSGFPTALVPHCHTCGAIIEAK